MSLLSLAIAWGIAAAAIIAMQRLGLRVYSRYFRSFECDPDEKDLPKAAIVLCLRGADPFLRECLDRLSAQDYPDFEIWILLDSQSDPARAAVEEWRQRKPTTNVHVTFLTDISDSASLKVSSMRHALCQLSEDIEAVALVDADTLVYPTWLRNVVAPLRDKTVGAVTGIRWYSPMAAGWGSFLRYVYNAFTIIPMYFLKAVWPGSMSLRREVFADKEFLEALKDTSSEDAVILKTLQRLNLKLKFSPDCSMLNEERCTMSSCTNFVRRQLLWTRLCNPGWFVALVGCLAFYALMLGGCGVLVYSVVQLHLLATSITTAAIALLWISNVNFVEKLDRLVGDRIHRTTGKPTDNITWTIRGRLFLGCAVILSFFVANAVVATLMRKVSWRGVCYRIEPRGRIRLLRYEPFVQPVGSGQQQNSL